MEHNSKSLLKYQCVHTQICSINYLKRKTKKKKHTLKKSPLDTSSSLYKGFGSFKAPLEFWLLTAAYTNPLK